MTLRTGSARRIWGIWRKLGELKLDAERDGWLSLARRSQDRGLGQVPHEIGVGQMKDSIERLCLSPYVEEPLHSKVIKGSYLNWEVVTCFSNLRFLCSILCTNIMNIICMFRISVYHGYGTYIYIWCQSWAYPYQGYGYDWVFKETIRLRTIRNLFRAACSGDGGGERKRKAPRKKKQEKSSTPKTSQKKCGTPQKKQEKSSTPKTRKKKCGAPSRKGKENRRKTTQKRKKEKAWRKEERRTKKKKKVMKKRKRKEEEKQLSSKRRKKKKAWKRKRIRRYLFIRIIFLRPSYFSLWIEFEWLWGIELEIFF